MTHDRIGEDVIRLTYDPSRKGDAAPALCSLAAQPTRQRGTAAQAYLMSSYAHLKRRRLTSPRQIFATFSKSVHIEACPFDDWRERPSASDHGFHDCVLNVQEIALGSVVLTEWGHHCLYRHLFASRDRRTWQEDSAFSECSQLPIPDLIRKKRRSDPRALFGCTRPRPAVGIDDVRIDDRLFKIVRHPKLPGSVPPKVTQY
jgi:hypothetical protein